MWMNPTLITDAYKLSHKNQYPKGTEYIVSNFTPRKSRSDDMNKVVVFGLRGLVRDIKNQWFYNFFWEEKEDVIKHYVDVISEFMNIPSEEVETSHLEELHDLQYLPIEITGLPEGTVVDVGTPILLIRNTDPRFFWLTNYLETWISNTLWGPCTSATIAYEFRKVLDKYAQETGDPSFVMWQGHDFSMRGMWGTESAAISGAAHLLSFAGTDTIPAVEWVKDIYYDNPIAGSVPATEHSVMSLTSTVYAEGEFEAFKRLITEVHPEGIVSIVSDTYDYWTAVSDFLPRLKNDILARQGKVVIRPDSGDPVDMICGIPIYVLNPIDEKYKDDLTYLKNYAKEVIVDEVRENTPHGQHGGEVHSKIFRHGEKYYKCVVNIDWDRYDKQYYHFCDSDCKVKSFEEYNPSPEEKGTIECLWDIFGGTVNDKGYKELDPHIGLIYGDSITLNRCKDICRRLKNKGFASTNVVLGIGSYSYQYNTRDTFGFAMKATYGVVNGEHYQIFKSPKGDTSKKSAKGIPIVHEDLSVTDNHTLEDLKTTPTAMVSYFIDGEILVEDSFYEVKERLSKYV